MLETGGIANLSKELIDADPAHGLRRQHLDRHPASQLHVAREVHRPHAPLSQLLVDEVPVAHGGLETLFRPTKRLGVDLEQVIKAHVEDFQHPPASIESTERLESHAHGVRIPFGTSCS